MERIQTDTAAENFARQLNESKENYFINGRWGTGKTEFLNNVRKKSKKKFVNLNLWDMKDNRNVVSIAYSKLHPIIYWGTNIVAIFMIAMSILFSSWYVSEIKNVFIGRYNEVNFLQLIGAFLVLFFSVWKTMGVKKENFYFWSMKFLLNENKVLFIDDFDRVDSKVREEAYKLFNILNGVIPIIILGDIDKITEEKTLAFLQKIIDTRVELPFALYTETIWDKYFDKLKETFGDVDLNNLKKIFIKEKRNLRIKSI